MSEQKRIIIDALAIGLPICGLHEYARQLCPRILAKCPKGFKITFIVPKGKSGCFGQSADYFEAGKWRIKMLRRLPIVRGKLFHTLHQLSKLKRFPGAANRLMTIHDINFAHTRTGRSFYHAERRFLKRLKSATHVSYITEFAQKDTYEHYPNNRPARVIYNGVTAPEVSNAQRPKGVPDGKFLFHLSSLEPYKRAELLVEMMDYLPQQTLVIAGRCRNQDLLQMIEQRKNVVMIGEVNDNEKAWLYEHCEAFLFPSMAEGFGLPPVEAMLCGKPTFLAPTTSLPEIGGDIAYYWPAMIPSEMAKEVETQLIKPFDSEAAKRHAQQFSWDICADKFIEYYSEILVND